jgi:rubredoxin
LKKYKCSICGYVYDEVDGDPNNGIAPGTAWESISDQWACPLCGAEKSDFAEETTEKSASSQQSDTRKKAAMMGDYSAGEVSATCSNLAKGLAKQYRLEEAELLNQLAEYYKSKSEVEMQGELEELQTLINVDLESGYADANLIATEAADRGALRSLVWGEKVTMMLNSILGRYDKQHNAFIENTKIYVCDICGFVYVGDQPPDICPVCKVPNSKIIEVKRG